MSVDAGPFQRDRQRDASMKAQEIAEEVLGEVDRAAEKHGEQLDTPIFRLAVDKIIAPGDDAKHSCQAAFALGLGSWADILLEEVAEAMDERDDPVALRAELIQAGAMCIAMVRALDHQESAEQHWDGSGKLCAGTDTDGDGDCWVCA